MLLKSGKHVEGVKIFQHLRCCRDLATLRGHWPQNYYFHQEPKLQFSENALCHIIKIYHLWWYPPHLLNIPTQVCAPCPFSHLTPVYGNVNMFVVGRTDNQSQLLDHVCCGDSDDQLYCRPSLLMVYNYTAQTVHQHSYMHFHGQAVMWIL